MQQPEPLQVPGIGENARQFADRHCRFAISHGFLGHWIAGFERDGGLPDFDPVDAPTLLPHLYLLELVDGRLRYRVSGEAVNRLFGSQHTGRYLDQVVPPDIYPHTAPFFFGVLQGGLCVFTGQVVIRGFEFLEFERTLVPVRRDGRVMLLASLALSDTAEPRRDRPPHAPMFRFRTLSLADGVEGFEQFDLRPRLDRVG